MTYDKIIRTFVLNPAIIILYEQTNRDFRVY